MRQHTIPICCGAAITALYVVGLVSGTELRHFVQTLPLWLGILLGYSGARTTRWAAMPVFLFWLSMMILIWLYLLGWAQMIHGHFSPEEIAMTLIVGISSLLGIVACTRDKGNARPIVAIAVFLLSGAFQLAAVRISFLPLLARR